jgi:tRNA (guanine-N7-)-methyltransferase
VPKQSESPGRAVSGPPGDDERQSPRAFFGRRKGHTLKPRQAALFDSLLPRLSLDLGNPAPSDLRSLFASAVDCVRLEIGFGGAEHLIAQAQGHPAHGFIGADAFVNAIGKALAGVEQHRLTNLRLHFGDASELIDWLPPASLTRIDLLYPDPWPKRRHWKRRFVQDDMLKRLARVLKCGGEFRFATDIADYADYALIRVLRSPDFVWTAQRADDWRKPWSGYTQTRYEAKAIRQGRIPQYYIFRRI